MHAEGGRGVGRVAEAWSVVLMPNAFVCTRHHTNAYAHAHPRPQVPAAWLKTYPSLKPLGPWTRDMLQRIDQLAKWIQEGYPKVYWLPGFTYPTGEIRGKGRDSCGMN